MSGTNKKSFKRNKSVARNCCKLKVLKLFLTYLLVTLWINKIPVSDNRHFLFYILKNENKEEFLIGSILSTLRLIEGSMLRKRLSQGTLSNVHLNNYVSYFKFILLLPGDINVDPGPIIRKTNDILWELLPFHNCSFSTECMGYQLDSSSEISNDA